MKQFIRYDRIPWNGNSLIVCAHVSCSAEQDRENTKNYNRMMLQWQSIREDIRAYPYTFAKRIC